MKNSYDLFYENSSKAKTLNDDYYHFFEQSMKYVFKHQSQVVKANILLSAVLDDLIKQQENHNDINKIAKNQKDYLSKIEIRIHYKDQIEDIKHKDSERYTISGLWITMCGYIVLLFFKEFLTQHYLINFSIDFLVAVIAFYIALHNIMNQYKIIKRFTLPMKPFIVQMVGIVVGIFVVLFTLKSPFDVSFLILVIAFLTNKKLFEKEIQK